MRNLIFKLRAEQPSHYEPEHNYLGFETIEIVEFNYDGEGTALILEDGELSLLSGDDLLFLFFSGWYKCETCSLLVKPNDN